MMSTDAENIRVVVRCRPLSDKEQAAGCQDIVAVDTVQGTVLVTNPNGAQGDVPPKMFTFDTVFDSNSKQLEVYNQAARPIVENVLEGYNGTIFAYGQTGTGKTYTMVGDRSVPELKGIIPNSFAHIFGHIAKAEDDKKFLVRASYLEIYNEEARDLLAKDQNARLEVKERPDIGVYVKGLSSCVVKTADELDRIMTLGNKNRAVGATNMNAHSSRSHAMFTITVECSERGLDGRHHVRVGKLHLVDLAGSERQSKTGTSGQRLREASKINLSLSTLGNVISALVDGKSTHVPYRNSKLTRLLQDSLGGNSKTLMCTNIGPADYNYDETISALRYANRAKNIKNKARINEDPKDALLRQFQKEIEDLRKQLQEGANDSTPEDDSSEEASGGDDSSDKKDKRKHKKAISEEKMREIQAQIIADRKILSEQKDMAQEERDRLAGELEMRERQLNAAREEHEGLMQKLHALEKKIIVGGENLLQKAEEQERLLEESARELEERKRKEAALREALEQKEAERLDMEERYSTLQEEAAGKTRKLKKVWALLMSAKAEMADLRQEHQREAEGLLENVRQLSRELRLNMLLIDAFIPPEYQELLERCVQWNEDIGEWQLKCIAYTGNNMCKQSSPDVGKIHEKSDLDISHVYLSYSPDGLQIPGRHRSGRKSARPKTSRPKSSRRDNSGVVPRSMPEA